MADKPADAGPVLDRPLLDGHIFVSLGETAHTTTAVDPKDSWLGPSMHTIPWDEYPHVTEHRDQHLSDGPHREVRAFDLGLDPILAGLQQTVASPVSLPAGHEPH